MGDIEKIERIAKERDTLARVAAELQLECNKRRDKIGALTTEAAKVRNDCTALMVVLEAANKREARLREALEKYGDHLWHCKTQNAGGGPCDCGLRDAIVGGAGK
jgi:predicted  nucleic acid-binding Zn-ribbon protein